jgi:hypothetical protein
MALATLLQLRTELKARGYDYLTDVRATGFVNTAYAELCELYPWPFLETTATLSVPGTLANCRSVISVNDASTSASVGFVDRQMLALTDTKLGVTGTPSFWYWEGDTLTTFPVASGQVTVRYVRYASPLVADTDSVLVPERWTDIIVDGACVRAAKDTHNWEDVAGLRSEYNAQVKNMHDSYFSRSYESNYILVTQRSDWHC